MYILSPIVSKSDDTLHVTNVQRVYSSNTIIFIGRI